MDDNPEHHPLVERFNRAEYLARELSEHLREAFVPKLSELRTASKVLDVDEVSDQQMFDRMNSLLSAEDFAKDVFDNLMRYLRSIERESRKVMGLRSVIPERPRDA